MFNINNIIKSKTGVILGALLMCFSISMLVMAYTDPTAVPPNNNIAPPMSTEGGTMTGPLNIETGTPNDDVLIIKDGGDLKIYNTTNGFAELYVDTAGELTVDGDLKVTGELKGIKPSGSNCANSQVLKYDSTNNNWTCADDTTGGGGSGDFSDGGETGGKDRTIGNTDNYDLSFLTNNTNRLHIQKDGNVGIGISDPGTYKLNVNGDTKITGDLEVTGSIERNSNVVWDAGNDGSGSGLDADTVDGYEAADLMGAGGGDSCPNCVLYQAIDVDGDGYTMLTGDCDETCDTCYIGSTNYANDGKDQDCDSEIDEIDNYKIVQCGDGGTWRPVVKSVAVTACQNYCSSQGLSYNSIGCGDEFGPNATNVAHTLNFADCSRGNIYKEYSFTPISCGRYQACYCNVYR